MTQENSPKIIPKDYDGEECSYCKSMTNSQKDIDKEHENCHGWYHCGEECCGRCNHCGE